MTQLYLIRHAQAEGNLYRRLQGWTDGRVTPLGHQQIEALRQRFLGDHFDCVYASDLSRTQVTAQAIAAPRKLSIQIDPALREAHLGAFCDVSVGQLKHMGEDLYHDFLDFSPRWTPEGGETFRQVALRVAPAVSRIAKAHPGQTVAIFSHAMAIRCFHAALRGKHPGQLKGKLPPSDNTAVSCYRVDNDGFHTVFENDASHLPPHLSTLGLRDKINQGGPEPVVWFREMDLNREGKLYNAARQETWSAVHPSLLGFDGPGFLEEARAGQDWHPDSLLRAMWDGTGVGILQLAPLQGAHSGAGYIPFLYVDSAYRGRGLGLQLVGQAVHIYRAMGRKCLRLQCSPHNAPAQRLYRSCGFTKIGHTPGVGGSVDVLELPI